MPRLFVLSGPDVGKSVAFEGEVDLGRAPGVAVVLRSPSVSRRHARILREGEHWWLEDLGSVNGTTVDGQRIAREALTDGSLFQLGDLELRFRLDAEPGADRGSSTTVLEGDASATGKQVPVARESGVPPGGAADEPFELEGDWDETVSAPERPLRQPRAGSGRTGRSGVPGLDPVAPDRKRTVDPAPKRGGAAAEARAQLAATHVRRGAQATASGGRVLQYKKVAERQGFFAADLAQYPFWVRALVGLFLIALFVGVTWGAFHLTATLRGRGSADINLESSP